ncbi:MAG: hypothetical protein IPL27_01925 [Lewinellaceae bacterium]|nr:hypothetical protein [Lewinellaceae bacterium]
MITSNYYIANNYCIGFSIKKYAILTKKTTAQRHHLNHRQEQMWDKFNSGGLLNRMGYGIRNAAGGRFFLNDK